MSASHINICLLHCLCSIAQPESEASHFLLQLVVLSLVPFTFVISAMVRWYLVCKFHAKEAASFVWQEGDVPW